MKKLCFVPLFMCFMSADTQILCKNRHYDPLFKDDVWASIQWEVGFYEGLRNDPAEVYVDKPDLIDEIIKDKIGEVLVESLNKTKKMLIDSGECKEVEFNANKDDAD